MSDSLFGIGQIVALVLVVLVAAVLIRRAGTKLRDELRAKHTVGPTLTPEQVKAIIDNGLATNETLFAMSPKEQQMLAATAMAMAAAKSRQR